MTEHLSIAGNTIAYDVTGEGPLVVLAHGMGDSRHSYRFVAPALVAAGYRVANVDIRGCGDSSLGWDGYSRTDIAGDLVAVVRHLGGPAVIIGQSISGGAATIAAATAPDADHRRHRAGAVHPQAVVRPGRAAAGEALPGRLHPAGAGPCCWAAWRAGRSTSTWRIPTKPADWDGELARIEAKMSEPGRMKALQAMSKTSPADAGAQLPNVTCPVLVIEGSLDPDWADPRAEGEQIIADLPRGLGELAVIEGAGHYPHAQTPDEVLALALPFLARTLTNA